MPPDSPAVPSRISPATGAFLLEFAENEYVIFRVCVSAANAVTPNPTGIPDTIKVTAETAANTFLNNLLNRIKPSEHFTKLYFLPHTSFHYHAYH
jgi:hypothetical protein